MRLRETDRPRIRLIHTQVVVKKRRRWVRKKRERRRGARGGGGGQKKAKPSLAEVHAPTLVADQPGLV